MKLLHLPWIVAPILLVAALVAWPSRPSSAITRTDLGAPAPAAATVSESGAAPATDVGDSTTAAPTRVTDRGVRPALGAIAFDSRRGRYVATNGNRNAVLSFSPALQQGLEKLLAGYRVPIGAAVLLDTRTGRVLAMAEHVERGPAAHVALQPIAPAASVFKIVTAAALLERGIGPESQVCFHGGRHRIQKALLSDNPRRDRNCLTLSAALGKSANVVFAKLAGRVLTPSQLRTEATRLLFDAPIPLEWSVEPSTARISDDHFEFATTAAGFGPVRLSPLHGALLASVVANGGRFVPPRLADEIDGAPAPGSQSIQLLPRHVAAALAEMMETTTTAGTARKVFRGDRRRSPLREIRVAGKTGSLAEPAPYRDYSWFVGFAPADEPRVAVATVVVNERLWRVKAPLVAREALRAYFAEEPRIRTRTASLDAAVTNAN